MLKKLLSVFLAIVIVAGTVSIAPLTVNAAETSSAMAQTNVDDVSVTATNSLGAMLVAEYEENVAGQEDYTGNNIYEIEIEDNSVYVELQALVEAQLVVALYDQNSEVMYGSGMASVTAEDRVVQIDLDFEIPEYFIVKAYLLDAESNVPLCKQYECDTYTQVMQEFLAKTTDDFDVEKVLNLDDSNSNNFLVYNDDTKIIETQEGKNIVTSADEENKVYVIENIDESISSLQKGDVFSCSYGDEDVLIIKISSITIGGTTATVYGEEIALEDAFDFVKIDASQGADETTVDNSDLEEGVEFVGTDEDAEFVPVGATLIDTEVTLGASIEYELDKKIGISKIFGSISTKFEASVKCFYDAKLFTKDEVEFSFSIKYEGALGVKVDIKTNDELRIKFGSFGFSPVPCVYVDFTPSIVFEGEVSAELSGVLTGQIGKKLKNGKFSDNSKKATFYPEFKISGEFFVGFSMEPRIGVVGNIITASAEAKVGVKIKAVLKYLGETEKENPDEIHLCSSCIDGDINWYLELSVSIKLLDSKNLTWKAPALKWTYKICDFYYSFDTKNFGWRKTCPNNEYKRTLVFYDSSFKPVEGVKVNGETSDKNGELTVYLTSGIQTLEATKESYTQKIKVLVLGKGESIHLFAPQVSPYLNDTVVDGVQPAEIESGKCGDNVFYTLYEDGTLKIKGTGDMYDYYYGEANNPFGDRNDINKVIVFDGVTYIGERAFCNCEGITSINISNTVTSIGCHAFHGCASLLSVAIPNSIKSINSWAFAGCSSLANINIPSSVTYIGYYAFSSCTSLESVTIPESVTYIDAEAFEFCNSLREINIKSGSEQYCSDDGVLFDKDKSTIVIYPEGRIEVSYRIPNSVTSIGERAFSECTYLENVTIPDSVTNISDSAFMSCTSLNNVVIPDSVTEIGEDAFYLCENLESISIPNSVQSIGDGAFSLCINLKSINIPNLITHIGNHTFYRCESLTDISIPTSVTSIGDEAFYKCAIKSINIPGSIASVGEGAFSDCVNLESVYITDIASWCSIDFYNPKSNPLYWADNFYLNNELVKDVVIPNGVIDTLSYSFSGSSLVSITIPDSVVTIGERAFSECTYLESVTMPNSVRSIGDSAFSACTNLKSIDISNSVTSIGNYAFEESGLKNITIPQSVIHIGDCTFENCDDLEAINVESDNKQYSSVDGVLFNSDKTTLIQYPKGKAEFSYIIPDSVENIGSRAFFYCSKYLGWNGMSLTSIVIPISVKSIGDDAFLWCELTDIYYPGTEEEWNEISIREGNEDLTSAAIHYNSNGEELVSVGASYTELVAVSSNSTTDETAVANTYSRGNLVPDTEAVLMVIEGLSDDYEITLETLLYISQTTVDENGKAEFTTYGDFSDTYYVVLVFGECSHSSYKWTIVNEAIYPDNGLEICVCDYCGEVIDSKEIEAVDPSSSVDKTEPTNNTEPTDTSDITEPISQYNLGDANEDGKVNIKDATAIQKHIANLIVLTEKGVSLADATQDGKVNIKDATAIQKHIAGIETGYPIGKAKTK